MPSVWIDVDLKEVDTDDLLDELEGRYLNDREQKLLIDLLKGDDNAKLDLFFQVKDKYSLLELQELFKENVNTGPIPKEQLALPL